MMGPELFLFFCVCNLNTFHRLLSKGEMFTNEQTVISV